MMKLYAIAIFCLVVPLLKCQIAAPRILSVKRIRLNAVRIEWSVESDETATLTRHKVLLLSNNGSSIVWPSQAIRVNKDGDDALDLEVINDQTYMQCMQLCLANSQCRFFVKSARKCYLKGSVPKAGQCGRDDECAVILAYSNEANLYDLPMNRSLSFKIQVYDAKTNAWSNYSEPSSSVVTSNIMPKIVNPIEMEKNVVFVKWNISEELIIEPTRYRISLLRRSVGDVKEWPAQMQLSNTDGVAEEVDKFPAQITDAHECTNACLVNPKCSLAVKDSKFCYLKALPSNQGDCAYDNQCWVLKEYESMAEIKHLPYDEVYRFQVEIHDDFSDTWSLPSDLSEEYSTRIKLIANTEKVDEFSYKISFKQEDNVYSISRLKILVSKNGSQFLNDLKLENSLKKSFSYNLETYFNKQDAVNQGRSDLQECLEFCYNDYSCVGVMYKDTSCFTTKAFDPFSAETCLPSEKCYSVTTTTNDTVIQNIDASTTYKIKIEYLTKYNTTGHSNEATFNTIDLSINITNSPLLQQKSGFIKCSTFNDSFVTQIIWTKDDTIIDENNKLGISLNNSQKMLMFSNLSHVTHNGQYRCSVKISINDQTLNSPPYQLIVKYGPIYTNKYTAQSTFRYNVYESAKFECEAEGYGPWNFGWSYNADVTRRLTSNTTYSNETFKYFSELKLNNLTRKDNGTYSCMLDSTLLSRINVFVPAAPSKPKILNVTSIDRDSFHLAFYLDDDGDFPVQEIYIEAENRNGNVESYTQQISVTGFFNRTINEVELDNDDIIRIKLKNAIGYSALSDPVKYTAPAFTSTGLTNTQLTMAIAIPIAVVILIAIIGFICYRKRRRSN